MHDNLLSNLPACLGYIPILSADIFLNSVVFVYLSVIFSRIGADDHFNLYNLLSQFIGANVECL